MPRVIVDRKNSKLEEAAFTCPVNAFRKSSDGQFVIDPNICLDCGMCQNMVEEAIKEDSEANQEDIEFNANNAEKWESIQ